MSDGPGDFPGALFQMMGQMPPPPKPKISEKDLLALLNAANERYQNPCPFKIGDLVTPRPDAHVKGGGRPCIVVELFDPPIVITSGVNSGHSEFGARLDMRVIHDVTINDGETHLMAHCVESYAYQPYTGPMATIDIDIDPSNATAN